MTRSNILKLCALTALAIFITSCSSQSSFKKQLKQAIEEEPAIIFEAIEKNPEQFVNLLQTAVKKAEQQKAANMQKNIEKEIDEKIESPLKPTINKEDILKGSVDAPLTIVEYSDFECPFCARGNQTISNLISKYPGQVRLVFKHLPLSFHQNAQIAAQYFEAVKLQDKSKALEFHKTLFANQDKLKKGETYLKEVVKKLNLNATKIGKAINSKKVKDKIENDIAEAKKFGMRGTPGYIVNGVPVRGAYPLQHFEMIMTKLKEKGKLPN